jgi:hypothetical protein
MVIAARCPTAAPKDIITNWNDSLATPDTIRALDAENEVKHKEVNVFIDATRPIANSSQHWHKITEWVVNPDSNSNEAGNIMLLQLPPTYEVSLFLLLIIFAKLLHRNLAAKLSLRTPKRLPNAVRVFSSRRLS